MGADPQKTGENGISLDFSICFHYCPSKEHFQTIFSHLPRDMLMP